MTTVITDEGSYTDTTRVTESGRSVVYRLEVIQQPERARACGSGAKSHADRRPIDPPPIVKLRIFEQSEAELTDITFSYAATFFLFASLEQARAIAHPRGINPATNIPVLTGGPVSGMAYLDRPTPAGYFLFPDLSIRHEGMYKLRFSLYEQPKEAGMNNAKLGPSHPSHPEARKKRLPLDAQHHAEFRASIHSDAFNVFSAKKFPGLSESTTLSKTLSDQGCRVRIRRDVRLRRPKQHVKDMNLDMDDESQYVREQASPSPGLTSTTNAAASEACKPSGPSSYTETPATSVSDGSKLASPTTFNPAHYHHNADGSVSSAFTYPIERQQNVQSSTSQTLRAAQSMNDMRSSVVADSSYQADAEGPSAKRARLPQLKMGSKANRHSGGSTPQSLDPHEGTIEVDSACIADAYSALDQFTSNRKRAFEHSFHAGTITAPLLDGARPLSPKGSPDMEAASSSSGEEQRNTTPRYNYPIPLEFRRAAGDSRNRSLPGSAAALNVF